MMDRYVLLSSKQYSALQRRSQQELDEYKSKIQNLESRLNNIIGKQNKKQSSIEKLALYQPALQSYLRARDEVQGDIPIAFSTGAPPVAPKVVAPIASALEAAALEAKGEREEEEAGVHEEKKVEEVKEKRKEGEVEEPSIGEPGYPYFFDTLAKGLKTEPITPTEPRKFEVFTRDDGLYQTPQLRSSSASSWFRPRDRMGRPVAPHVYQKFRDRLGKFRTNFSDLDRSLHHQSGSGKSAAWLTIK